MGSQTQTGLLLILGAIVSLIGWMLFYPVSPSDSIADQASGLLADPEMGQVGVLMGFGGMIALFIGLIHIGRGMSTGGGKGAAYAGITTILLMALIAVMIIGTGLELGTTEATSPAGAATLMDVANAIYNGFEIAFGLAMISLGIGIALNKNFNIIIAALAIVSGATFGLSGFVDVDGMSMIGWMGFNLTAIVMGALTLKSKS
jgi:hypothetical protein